MRKQIKKLNYTIHNFETSDNLKLYGILNKSTSKLNEKTILIHIHGMCGDLFSGVGQVIAETTHKNKLSSFLINTRGHGIVTSFKQKDKDGNRVYHTGGTAYENFENSVLDIDSAINYLKTLGYKKFILSGHSTGCQKITYYQLKNIKNKSIKALIMLAPGDDLNVEKKNLGDKFQLVLKKAKEKMKSTVLFTTEDFGLLSAKRFYNLFKKTSIEGNLFNYTKNLEYLQTIKVPILSLIGKQDPYFLDTQKAVNNISSNLSNKKSKSLLVSGNHSYYSFENDLKKEIELFLKTIL
ncbi:MAG: alpha/beta fold hydrolase [Nanoarchaeales archaeon]|nr:alpha/beta fold hydrolase [Nanoarchaeales archaeon]